MRPPAVEDIICMKYCYINAALSLGLTTRCCSSTSSQFFFFFAGVQVAGNSPKAGQHACNRGRAAVINIPTNIKNIMNNKSITMSQNYNHCNGLDRLKYWQRGGIKISDENGRETLNIMQLFRWSLSKIIKIISSTGNEKSYCPLVPTECQVGSEDSPAACQDHHLLTTSCPLSPWSSSPPSQEANLLVHSLLNQPKQEPTVFERSARLNFGGEEEEIWLRRRRNLLEKEKTYCGEGEESCWRRKTNLEENRRRRRN